MTTDQRHEGSGKRGAKKAAQRRVASKSSGRKSGKESEVTITTNMPTSVGSTATASDAGQKGWEEFLGDILPGFAGTVAQNIGIDPRVAGQTVSQILNIFGIGGSGKAFNPTLSKGDAVSQLQQLVTPYLTDPSFVTGLQRWLQLAIEPVQAHKEGKAYQPSVDLSKDWLQDIGNTLSSVNWSQVAQVGMQTLPWLLTLI